MHRNLWLHTLPDCTTYATPLHVPQMGRLGVGAQSVREFLLRADPRYETVKAAEFERGRFAFSGRCRTN
jgi:hypothetical protein